MTGIARVALTTVALSLGNPSLTNAQVSEVEQVLNAVEGLPEEYRTGARVLGYRAGELVELRGGSNHWICVGDRPGDERFQVTCYHAGLEPFMRVGRDLRTEGLSTAEIRETRRSMVEEGTIELPERSLLVSLFGELQEGRSRPDSVTSLNVIYLPFATEEETGIPESPTDGPWLMDAGQHRAHVMISGPARPLRKD